jgi:cell division protein FtsI (penicillin-binding protein 3)
MAAQAAESRIRNRPLKAPRGAIVDRDGMELAISVSTTDIAVDMKKLTELQHEIPDAYELFAAAAAAAIGSSETEVRERMYESDTKDRYVPLAKKIDLTSADKLRDELLEMKLLPALSFEASYERVHPAGESGLRVLGTITDDGPGPNAGVERQFDEYLTGEPGIESQEVGRDGSVIPGTEEVVRPAEPGSTVRLTLDRSLQYEAERALTKGVREAGAAGGVAIVGRPGTGELLAVAGASTDPKTGEVGLAEGPKPFSDAYQAGSVFKLIPVATAIEDGQVNLDTTFQVADYYKSYDRTFTDHDPHPQMPMTVEQILAQSSNVGTIHIANTIGRERLHTALSEFGFGKATGVSPAESTGILPPIESWSGPDLAATAIGTHQSATAVQLWSAYNVIANNGTWVPPRVVDGIELADGDLVTPDQPPTRKVVSETTASQVKQALRSVVTEGTGKKWDLPGFEVGAKTGTGRMVAPGGNLGEDGYRWADGNYHYFATFTGFFPVNDPQVSITVILEDVTWGLTGSTAAGPVFSELARLAIRELGVVPVAGAGSALLGPQRALPAVRAIETPVDTDAKASANSGGSAASSGSAASGGSADAESDSDGGGDAEEPGISGAGGQSSTGVSSGEYSTGARGDDP